MRDRAARRTGARPWGRGARSVTTSAFVGYLALAVCFFGIRLASHPEGTLIGDLFADPQIFVWSFGWFPHAVLHGESPLYTHAIWAPSGFDLVWGTSVPALAALFAPLTLAFGPILSYNAACILMAAVGAWSAFLLCRHLTGAIWPSLVGGYLFGFSSYVLGGELDHIHTVAVFALPLTALLVLRFLETGLSARRFAVELAVLLGVQAYISTEILFTLTLALVCSLVLAFVLIGAFRPRLRQLAAPLAGAYALAAVLAAPVFYYALRGYASRPPPGAENYVSDLLNFVVPTRITLGGWWSSGLVEHFPANVVEQGSYLGLPALAIVCAYAWSRRRAPAARFLTLSFVIAAIASLGSWLTVNGDRLIALPWLHLASRPLFENLAPVRLSAYTALAGAVIVAIWAASPATKAWIRIVLPGLAVLAIAPDLVWAGWANSPPVPRLFTTGLYRSCLGENENVLALPLGPGGDSMIWQAESGFWFRIAGGYVSPTAPPQFSKPHSVQQIAANDQPPKVTTEGVREFVRLKQVSSIVVDARAEAMWRRVLAPIAHPQKVGDVLIYRIAPDARSSERSCRRA